MPTVTDLTAEIEAFEQAYDYDAGYLYKLLELSPAAVGAFRQGQAMAQFRDQLPVDAYFVAAITVMQQEDCGGCLQLNLKMAVEAGVERNLLASLLQQPEQLPPELSDIREFTLAVVRGESPDESQVARIRDTYGDAAYAELALCIAGSQIYPTIKRAMLKQGACATSVLEF